MNNNIIKSLRRTLFCTVAAAAVTIGFTACADEMFETQNVTAPANGNGYKISIAANIGSGDTRAVAYNSETGGYDATFETSDGIFVYNITKNANGQKDLTPDANGKKVNLVGELSFWAWDSESQASVEIVPEVGDELILYYKCGRSINYNYLYGEIIHDYALAKVTIESINDGVIKTSAATFAHPQSLYKIKFTGIASDKNIKNVIIQSKYNKLVSEYHPYYVTSDGQQGFYEFFNQINYSYGQEGTKQHELIFSLRFSNNKNSEGPSGDEISFVALGSDGHYYKGAKSVTTDLENGKYYQAEVAMADAGKVMTLTNNKTEEVVVLDSYTRISSNEAPYTLENTGYDLEFSWFGGAESLTLKNISLNSRSNSIRVYSDEQDIENTKSHHLILDGVNTMNCADVNYAPNAIVVRDNCSLNISAKSADGKLNMTNCGLGLSGNNSVTTIESGEISVSDLSMWENSTLNIEGGVLTVNRWINGSGSSSCIISKGGKLRIAKNSYISEGLIKAADGYVLVVSDDGEYWVFTAIKDDGSDQAQGILMMPSTATIGYNPSMNQYLDLRAYVYPEMTTDKSITWTTSDPNVVQIGYSYNNYANIYSTGVGTATVTATINGDTNLSAKCEITVKPFGGIWYENYEVSVTPESAPFTNPLKQAGKITSITYTSSDTSVATVNASTGEVTIKSGATTGQTVTITATATVEDDGEYIYWEDRKTASYTVKLAPATGQGEHEDYTPASW